MKLDPAKPSHYLICAGIGCTGGLVIAVLLLFFTEFGDPYPMALKVLVLVVTSIGMTLLALSQRPKTPDDTGQPSRR